MSFEETWSGDWRGRIMERLVQRGYRSVLQYADDRIGISLLELANELGQDDIAGAQLSAMMFEEATRTNAVPRTLRDLLVRELRDALPDGWQYPLPDEARSEVAGAVARWRAEFQQHLQAEYTIPAARNFLDAELPNGWLPAGPDDPVIVSFVERCLGRHAT